MQYIEHKCTVSDSWSKIELWWMLCCLLSFNKWRVDGSCQINYCPCILKGFVSFQDSKTHFPPRNNTCVRNDNSPWCIYMDKLKSHYYKFSLQTMTQEQGNSFLIKQSPKWKMISSKMMLQNCQHNCRLFLILGIFSTAWCNYQKHW